MTKLKLLLREYEDVRFATDGNQSSRFLFESNELRYAFVLRLSEIKAEFFLYADRSGYKIEVFFNDDNNGVKR